MNKPCPFCGATGVTVRIGTTFRWLLAECSTCGATGPEVRVKALGAVTPAERIAAATPDAIEAWNTRAAVDAE